MLDLDQLQRLAEEAADEAEGDWFCADLLGPGAPPISASTKARGFMHAFDPDTARKLIAVARAARASVRAWDVLQKRPIGRFTGKEVPACEAADKALRSALEELK